MSSAKHLFLLGLHRLPQVGFLKNEGVPTGLQHVLDRLGPCPAFLRNAVWDVIAWNRPTTLVLTDYGSRQPKQRNILRSLFLDPRVRAAQHGWQRVAQFAVGAFRIDAARAGATAEMEPLVDELCRLSTEFWALWRENDVRRFGEGIKRLRHPTLGALALQYSAFAVDGRSDLKMVVFNPTTPGDADKISFAVGKASAVESRWSIP
jgi:hypothetical protein